ncbi:MAG: BACON domain-containing protein [Propionibacteriaceae bacterium]|nr:BACON domain-containing protein [Propionibacteriaceae bacterium]
MNQQAAQVTADVEGLQAVVQPLCQGGGQPPAPDAQIRLSKSIWTPAAGGGTLVERVIDGSAWTASADANWLHLSRDSGAGGDFILVTADSNPGGARSGVVTVSAVDGSSSRTLVVNQAAAPPKVAVVPSGVWQVASDGGAQPLTVVTNQESWTAQSNASWLTVEDGVVTVAANPGAARTGRITVQAGPVATTLTVRQAAAPSLALSRNTVPLLANGGRSLVVVLTNQATWQATADQPWVHLSASSGGNAAVVQLSGDANTTKVARDATITFTTADGRVVKTVLVRQFG